VLLIGVKLGEKWVGRLTGSMSACSIPVPRTGFQTAWDTWVLETHAPLFYENDQRKTTVLNGLAMEARGAELTGSVMLLVCVTEALKEIVVRESGIPVEKVVVIPNGVDIESFDPKRHEPKYVCGLYSGFVGRLYALHGWICY